MVHRLRHSLALSVVAVALFAAPVVLNGASPLIAGVDAHAGNGKGKGGGGGNGHGNGGGGDHGSSDSASVANASSGGSDTGPGQGKKKKKAVIDDAVESAAIEELPGKKRSLNAELGRLNSLKRNINGLMNSSDAKMDGVRAFIVANGTLVDAEADLEAAGVALADAGAAYLALATTLGVAGYPDITPTGLQTSLDAVNAALVADPTNPDLLTEQAVLTGAIASIGASAELQNLTDATNAAADAEAAVAEAEEAISPEALEEALLMAANKPVTDDVVAWASEELGVGDADGLIDEYLASR